MNKNDRKILKEQVESLEKYWGELPCDLSSEESEVQNIIDELDERIGNAIGGKGDELEEQKNVLEEAVSAIQDAQAALEEASDRLQEAIDNIESLL